VTSFHARRDDSWAIVLDTGCADGRAVPCCPSMSRLRQDDAQVEVRMFTGHGTANLEHT
jgi:hypothetical protein